MESENFNKNGNIERNSDNDCDIITNNNSSKKCHLNSVPWKDLSWTEVGVISLIDLDKGVGGSQPKSPSPPKSPPQDSLLSSPEKFDSPDSFVYQSKKKQKHCEKYLTNSSPMSESDDKDGAFDWLSDEIILYIFSLIPKNMLATLSLVCKRFRYLCLDESFWPRFDLSFKTLTPFTLGYVMSRGVRALRLNSSAISSPIFDPTQPFRESYTFKIEYLDLSAVHISVKDLERLLFRCKSLKKLSVEACEVSDEVCRAISENEKLDTLDMAMCSGITNKGLYSVVTSCKLLENVNISWCGLSSEAIAIFCENVSSTLLTLNLAGSLRSLCNKDVENFASRCPELTEVDMSDCIRITGEAVSCLVKDSHNLQSLSISRSYKISGAAILQLKGKPSLCTLNLFGNSREYMFSAEHMKFLKSSLPGVAINSEMMSSIARPTVGIRRTSIWGIRCRE